MLCALLESWKKSFLGNIGSKGAGVKGLSTWCYDACFSFFLLGSLCCRMHRNRGRVVTPPPATPRGAPPPHVDPFLLTLQPGHTIRAAQDLPVAETMRKYASAMHPSKKCGPCSPFVVL
jgi:hypothetical protein